MLIHTCWGQDPDVLPLLINPDVDNDLDFHVCQCVYVTFMWAIGKHRQIQFQFQMCLFYTMTQLLCITAMWWEENAGASGTSTITIYEDNATAQRLDTSVSAQQTTTIVSNTVTSSPSRGSTTLIGISEDRILYLFCTTLSTWTLRCARDLLSSTSFSTTFANPVWTLFSLRPTSPPLSPECQNPDQPTLGHLAAVYWGSHSFVLSFIHVCVHPTLWTWTTWLLEELHQSGI